MPDVLFIFVCSRDIHGKTQKSDIPYKRQLGLSELDGSAAYAERASGYPLIPSVNSGDPLEQATPYIKALSHLWGWGELTVLAAQNMDFSTAEEIEERINKAIEEGLEKCKTL